MGKFLIIVVLGLFVFSCSSKKEQNENSALPISNAKISEGKGEIFDTIQFRRTKAGLHFVKDKLSVDDEKPNLNSHVTVEYRILSKDGELIHQSDSNSRPCQVYIKDCNKLLAEAICLMGRKSEVKAILDSENVKALYSEVKMNENYLVDICLIDFHQHYD